MYWETKIVLSFSQDQSLVLFLVNNRAIVFIPSKDLLKIQSA